VSEQTDSGRFSADDLTDSIKLASWIQPLNSCCSSSIDRSPLIGPVRESSRMLRFVSLIAAGILAPVRDPVIVELPRAFLDHSTRSP
jgi:hypothetical protein